MSRFFYSLLILLLMPWAMLHLAWRARRQPEYLRHWNERFGRFQARPAGPLIWLHAVSVGETRAAAPLIAALRARHPGHRILLTHMTPTGRATAEALFGDEVERCYLPYDTPWAARRFLAHFRPDFGVIMETEIWPNLVAACHHAGVPLLLVNARLSEKSARRYARFPALTRAALEGLTAICAIGAEDAERLRRLGAPGVAVTGNMKFDIAPPEAQLSLGAEFRRRMGTRPVFLCASTREGEEAAILDAWKKRTGATDALLVLVPRHPQRFDDVTSLVVANGLRVQRRSDNAALDAATDVWIGDSMGEMYAYYVAADIAFIGGSLLPYGSQNLIEPCAVGTPVLVGPSTFNFHDAAHEAIACGAAQPIATAEGLVAQAMRLLGDTTRRTAMSAAGKSFAARHRGATARTVERLPPVIQAGR